MLLLPGGRGPALVLAQSRAQAVVAGAVQFLQPNTSLWSRDAAHACPLPWRGLQSRLAPACRGPEPFGAHRLQCFSSHGLLRDCERRGLWSWVFPWPHPLGARLARARGPGWTCVPGVAEHNRGLCSVTSPNRAGKGLCLGCCWQDCTWGSSTVACCCPTPMGTVRRASTCTTAPSQGGGAQGWVGPALSLVGCLHTACSCRVPFCHQRLGSCPAPVLVCDWELGLPGALGSSVELWHVHGPAGALVSPRECEGRALPPA